MAAEAAQGGATGASGSAAHDLAAAAAAARGARKRRQLLAREAQQGRLAAAFRRIEALEAELAAAKAALASREPCHNTSAPPEDDLVQRLALVAPVLRAGIAGQCQQVVTPAAQLSHLEVVRRNVAVHHFATPAARIRVLPLPALNHLQRGAGHRGRPARRHRRRLASRAAHCRPPPRPPHLDDNAESEEKGEVNEQQVQAVAEVGPSLAVVASSYTYEEGGGVHACAPPAAGSFASASEELSARVDEPLPPHPEDAHARAWVLPEAVLRANAAAFQRQLQPTKLLDFAAMDVVTVPELLRAKPPPIMREQKLRSLAEWAADY